MATRQKFLRPPTAILLFVHAHSLVFFVGLLCVASNDSNPVNSTTLTTVLSQRNLKTTTLSPSNIKVTKKARKTTLSTSTATTGESFDELDEETTGTRFEPSTLAPKNDRWRGLDIQHATSEELRVYKKYLELELANVTRLLVEPEKKSKRYIPLPISSSLPDYISSDFVRSRINESSRESAEKASQIGETPDGTKKQTSAPSETSKEEKQSGEEDQNFSSGEPSSKIKPSDKQLSIVREERGREEHGREERGREEHVRSPDDLPSRTSNASRTSDRQNKAFGAQTTRLTDTQTLEEPPSIRRSSFEPTINHTSEECKRLTQAELVTELKQKGSYNPNLMAWDVAGVFRFLDRSIVDQYERQIKSHKSSKQAVQRNVEALERILTELNLNCDVRSPEVLLRLGNLTMSETRRTVMSPSIRMSEEEVRFKRNILADDLIRSFNKSRSKDDPPTQSSKRQKMIGDVHVVPFGCDKRGEEEDGYLRLCGACQAIRKLPDSFFPPFINEVVCDDDRACLYFYEYPHGKCKQKHMNFVVLRNVGTDRCQVWQKFNLNVRVSCECFVDSASFFSKYV